MVNYLSKIQESCQWVINKKLKFPQGIYLGLKWVDWEHKFYSPAFAVLWHSQVKTNLNFYPIPDYLEWNFLVAKALNCSTSWVNEFNNACIHPDGYATVLKFSGEVSEFQDQDQLAVDKIQKQVVSDKSALETAQELRKIFPSIPQYKRNFSKINSIEKPKIDISNKIIDHFKYNLLNK